MGRSSATRGRDDAAKRRKFAGVARSRAVRAVPFAIALALGGCTAIDNMLASVPIFSFLREAPFFDPYEAPRQAPPNSVPYSSPNGELLPPTEASDAGLTAFAARIGNNPLPPDERTLARGKLMFDRHCLVCHGPTGTGNGPIIGPGRFPFATNLTLPVTQARPDGYIYGIVRAGRGLMPAYGSRITHADRWAIVTYVRQLQASAGGAAPAPAPPAAAAPGDTAGAQGQAPQTPGR